MSFAQLRDFREILDFGGNDTVEVQILSMSASEANARSENLRS
jgi:hypothetical protein